MAINRTAATPATRASRSATTSRTRTTRRAARGSRTSRSCARVDGKISKVKVCTRCLAAGKVKRAPRGAAAACVMTRRTCASPLNKGAFGLPFFTRLYSDRHEDRAHHRHHRPGRLVPRRAAARQGLPRRRRGAPQLARRTSSASPTSSTASSWSPRDLLDQTSLTDVVRAHARPTRSTTSPRRASCRRRGRSRCSPASSPRSASRACSRR